MKKNYKFENGYLKVSEIHEIYYEVCGTDNGQVFLFVHGGPGVGFSEKDKRFFDFEKHKVIFFDQRGSSKSKPFGCIKENTTQDLVDDINVLLKHLNIQKVNVFGGSWGTTLSLVFAIQNAEKVKSLLLRGVFLGDKKSIEHFLNGGVENNFPKEWSRFKKNVPIDSNLTIPEYYLDQMLNGTPENRFFYCYEWAFYEISIFKKGITEKEIEAIIQEFPFESLAIMEAYYLSNNCFIDENYILNNTSVLDHIPITIIHGKQDSICPVEYAELLNDKLNNSILYIEDGGHSDSEPAIEKRIIKVLND
ncbi:prolyl aminopeptidase [Flavobacterium sp. LC2016-12]|uniref:prolyl aminopeptidase n=1 Tax=Flavobacterium sp. LC2016-12 TaxID=2783794 RepID=UPI001889D78F|nr:prolyl aminopeptidase [Flavobacterium sp. LC2016-12]MBF4467393.1 prolyl aminopeptidase [Flavobacterium sp. LC2016-12]